MNAQKIPAALSLLLTLSCVVSEEVAEKSEKDLLLSLKKCNAELIYSEIRFSAFVNSLPPFVRHASRMLNDDRFVDLYLRSGNNVYPAHRIILAASSPVFSSLIYNETLLNMGGDTNANESSHSSPPWRWSPEKYNNNNPPGPNNDVLLPSRTVIQMDDDINGEMVEAMLGYIYTGKVGNITDLASQLIVAAERYGLTELKQLCERVILGQVKLGNSIEMLKLGRDVNSSKLRRKALAVMKANAEASSPSSPRGYNVTTKMMMSSNGNPIIAKIFYIKQKHHKNQLLKHFGTKE